MFMKTLQFRSLKREFKQLDDLQEIRTGFGIPERKNIYRVTDTGELYRIDENNIRDELKNNDRLEAISEFILG